MHHVFQYLKLYILSTPHIFPLIATINRGYFDKLH